MQYVVMFQRAVLNKIDDKVALIVNVYCDVSEEVLGDCESDT